MLLREQEIARLMDGGLDVSQICIHAPESRCTVLRFFLLHCHGV
jgi:hypothetical protein